jgi:hypothetical protein
MIKVLILVININFIVYFPLAKSIQQRLKFDLN